MVRFGQLADPAIWFLKLLRMSQPESIENDVRHLLPEDVGAGGGGAGREERYFSVRWMLERERAREESDDCSSAFAIIPVGKRATQVAFPRGR